MSLEVSLLLLVGRTTYLMITDTLSSYLWHNSICSPLHGEYATAQCWPNVCDPAMSRYTTRQTQDWVFAVSMLDEWSSITVYPVTGCIESMLACCLPCWPYRQVFVVTQKSIMSIQCSRGHNGWTFVQTCAYSLFIATQLQRGLHSIYRVVYLFRRD